MFSSYLKLALRNLLKNRLYAAINILGLAIGLTIFLSSMLLIQYETNYDHMFKNRDRIFTVGTLINPNAELGFREIDSVRSAVGAIIEDEVPDLEAVARTINRQYLVSAGMDHYLQGVRFADSKLTRIFDFTYIQGDASALDTPQGLILTVSTAEKIFGRTDVLGETLTLDHRQAMQVAAVIEDIPRDSHFHSIMMEAAGFQLDMFAPFSALAELENIPLEGEWRTLSFSSFTYLLLPEDKTQAWLQDQIDLIYEKHVSEDQKEFNSGFRVRPLIEANTQIWDAIGLPVILTIQLLGLLVLVIACVNYTNLATAQSFNRTREVGLRKTLGAKRPQLLLQFLTESLSLSFIAMLIAVAAMELLIPLFNQWAGKNLQIDYLSTIPWLLSICVIVGLLAGSYPAHLITRSKPIESLRGEALKARRGNRFRNVMIGTQFAISCFMLALVMIVYFQNQKIEESSQIFPKEKVVVMLEGGLEEKQSRRQTLRQELLAIPDVEAVSFSSQVPFQQNHFSTTFTPESGNESAYTVLNWFSVDYDYMEVYDIPLLTGRYLQADISNDTQGEHSTQVNVIVNQLAAARLGFGAGADVLGKVFYDVLPDDETEREAVEYTVVGLMPDQNLLGLQNNVKPVFFVVRPSETPITSVRIKTDNVQATLSAIDGVWARVIPEYPSRRQFLGDIFEQFFSLLKTINKALAAFAFIALTLALIGLFGLAAFMAERRTKEIGMRKVLGARAGQISRLLIWQFSIPVMWSLLVAIPLSYIASDAYLNSFSERFTLVVPVILVAGVASLLLAWGIVAGHAYRVANAVPIKSLRYE